MKFKKYYLIVFFACFISPVLAQKHPYLFFTKERTDRLKIKIKQDSVYRKNWTSILVEADLALEKGDTKLKIDYLSLAWLMTGEKKYADKVKESLIKLCTQKTWSNEEMLKRIPAWNADLKTAENCWYVSIGYDAIYDVLSAEEKKVIVEGLVRMGIKPALNDWLLAGNRIHTLNSMGHNWWSACVGMAGIASLAVVHENKEAKVWAEQVSQGLEEWFTFSGDDLQFKPRTMDRDGGMYESFNYASFGSGEFLFFRLAYSNAFPGIKQPNIPGMENMANWFMQASYPRTGEIYSLNFGDSESSVAADRSIKLLEALGYKNNNNIWYLNQVHDGQHREGLFANTPIGIVYQPDIKSVPEVPDLPTGALYKDMGWAMLRNSWKKDETFLGVKSGYTWNHSHADANSFILFHKGEPIIKDAGNSWYGSKDYPAYFFQSPAHNVVLFNGKAQPKEQQYNGSPLSGRITEMLNGKGFKYILADAAGPTSANFTRNFRSYLWIGKVILVIDDVHSYETGNFSWLLHPAGTAKKVGGDISIINGKSSVLVRPLFPETLVETGFDHDFPEKMRLEEITAPKARDPKNPTETYYSVQYPNQVKQTKFITAIILKDNPDDKTIPKIERLHNETMNGVKITQGGKTTEVYLNLLADGRVMHLNSINSFNNIETDAYLAGITYPEGTKKPGVENISDYFIGYGSYLKIAEKSIFNSLSKLYMITKVDNGTIDMVLRGQPVLNARFNFGSKPVKFILNEKITPVELVDGELQVKLRNYNKPD